jgi:N-hydroxyarylamine O-acetyltransferase
MSSVNLNAYFERIGFAGSIAPNFATLEQLAALHPAAIPFENLDPLLGRPVRLEPKALERKMLVEGRGGYCFEHALLLAEILVDLDFGVRLVGARVLVGEDPPVGVSHLALLVDVGGASYLVDVGFGRQTPTGPLRLRDGVEQDTPHGRYRLSQTETGWRLAMEEGPDVWTDLYEFAEETLSRELIEAANAEVASSASSPFTRELRVALSPPGERLALRDGRFSRYVLDGETEPERRVLADVAELKSVLSERFRLSVPGEDDAEARLAALIAPAESEAGAEISETPADPS